MLPTTNIKIDLLGYHPECIPVLAKIWYEEIGKRWEPNTLFQEIISWCNSYKNSEKLPLAYVALDDDTPIGMCALAVNDGIQSDLMPWLCDLCVDRLYQKQGIGKLLVASIKNKAKHLGFHKLYLFILDTSMLSYYKKLGWEKVGTDMYKGHNVTIMQIDL